MTGVQTCALPISGYYAGSWFGDPKEDGSESSDTDQQSEYVYVHDIMVEDATLSRLGASHHFGTQESGFIGSATFEIWNSGTGTLDYTLSESASWLSLSPSSGSSTGEKDLITVSVDTTGLSDGSYSESIEIGRAHV